MPLRDSYRYTSGTGLVEHWLHRILIEDWSLKLLALAITLVLWFVVSGREVERELPVEARIDGRPAATFEVKEVIVTPPRVRVTGAASHVNALGRVPTDPISLEGRSESFDAPHTAIHLADPKVVAKESVNVHVTIVAVGESKPKPRDAN